jgi:hypothetical protein
MFLAKFVEEIRAHVLRSRDCLLVTTCPDCFLQAPQWLTYVGLCLHIVWCNAKGVGDREILETYLNPASKNTSKTDIFHHGTKPLLSSVIFHENRVVYELMRGEILWSLISHTRRYNAAQKRCGLHAGKLRQEYRHTHSKHLLLFHGNIGYANAPEYYVVRTLPAFFISVKDQVVLSNIQVLSTQLLHGRNNCLLFVYARGDHNADRAICRQKKCCPRNVHAHLAVRERLFKIISKQRRLITNKLTDCGSKDRNMIHQMCFIFITWLT